jgi:thiol-disulfide isomerase/thioredoxin
MQRAPVSAALLLAATLVASVAGSGAPPTDDPDSGAELIGRPAPAWAFTRWVRGPARSLGDYRGKVVLVRWWTEGCHFCRATLPALERLRRERGDQFVVVGVFHPKPEPREVSDRHILEVARQLGFDGPIAFDRDWKTLDRYWLDGNPDRSWTSVSFLIDQQGVIRWVHGGGEYHPSDDPAHQRCELEYQGLVRELDRLLPTTAAR